MADNPAEKPLPPSAKKLRDLRRREGQVARSQDWPVFVAFAAVIAYLLATWQKTSGLLQRLFDPLAFQFTSPFAEVVRPALQESMQIWLQLCIPPAIIASLAYIGASAFNTSGIVINPKALTPDINRLNPAGAFKNMFGLQAILDLVKQAIKLAIFLVVCWLLARQTLNPSLWAPTCGQECATTLTVRTILILIIVALVLMLVFAVADIKISKAMFLRQNRMDHEEMKREQKEQNGSPEMRRERNRIRRESQRGGYRGFGKANILINAPDGAIGLAFVQGEIDVPVVVIKVAGQEELKSIRNQALGKKVPIYDDPKLVADLMAEGRVGDPIKDKFFTPVAIALYRRGLFGTS